MLLLIGLILCEISILTMTNLRMFKCFTIPIEWRVRVLHWIVILLDVKFKINGWPYGSEKELQLFLSIVNLKRR